MSTVRSIAIASGHTRFRYRKTITDLLEKNGCTLTGFAAQEGWKTVGLDPAKEIVSVWLRAEFADGPGDERNVACNRHLLELDTRNRKQGSL
jgi:ribose 5-phosphate isomerase RpiB